jgi:hypothetical protein
MNIQSQSIEIEYAFRNFPEAIGGDIERYEIFLKGEFIDPFKESVQKFINHIQLSIFN